MIGMILSKILAVDTTLDYSLGTYPIYWHKFGPSNKKKKKYHKDRNSLLALLVL